MQKERILSEGEIALAHLVLWSLKGVNFTVSFGVDRICSLCLVPLIFQKEEIPKSTFETITV